MITHSFLIGRVVIFLKKSTVSYIYERREYHRFNADLNQLNPYLIPSLMVGLNLSFNPYISQS
jgi:hypothetical protein